jgi:hypothetical protein
VTASQQPPMGMNRLIEFVFAALPKCSLCAHG